MEQTQSLDLCCTCLKAYPAKEKLINLNFVATEDVSYKFKLKYCVPEMMFENNEESLLCTPCLTSLEVAYTFRCMCLRNEGKLAEARQNYKQLSINYNGVEIKREPVEPVLPEEELDSEKVPASEVKSSPKRIRSKRIISKLTVARSLRSVDRPASKNNPDKILPITNNQSEITLTPIPVARSSEILEKVPVINEVRLTDLEIMENACKTDPELLANNCDVSSLDCRVSLVRVDDAETTVKLPIKKLYKYKPQNKFKKDVNYWCNFCSKYVAIGRRHRYVAHMLNHKNIKAYKCDKCPREFTYAETLSKHRRECNGDASPSPTQTFQIVPNVAIKTEEDAERKSHIKAEVRKVKKESYSVDNDWIKESGSNKYLKGKDDDGNTRRSLRAKTVKNTQAAIDAYHCEICEYQTYNKHKYQVHMMKHFNDRRFECTKCPKKFFENWELNRHLRSVHSTAVKSRRLPSSCYNIQNIKPLIASKTNVSENTDTNDSESTAFAKALEPSISLTVPNDTVVTPIIQSIESLANNVTDNGAISFACKVCNLSFKDHNLLMSHMCTHKTNNQPTSTNTEQTTNPLPELGNIETHMPPKLPPKKKKKRRFFCVICNMEFASKDHANIHTGAKPYDCQVCGKEFAAYSTLRKHRWTHSEETKANSEDEKQIVMPGPKRQKFTCDICSKTFINKWQITSHSCQSATGEAVYRCQICKNAFVGRTALIEHMGLHVNQSTEFYQ